MEEKVQLVNHCKICCLQFNVLRQGRAGLAAHKIRTICLSALLVAHNDVVVLRDVKMITAVISNETTTTTTTATTYTAFFVQRYH
jgi:hypothetical protein